MKESDYYVVVSSRRYLDYWSALPAEEKLSSWMYQASLELLKIQKFWRSQGF